MKIYRENNAIVIVKKDNTGYVFGANLVHCTTQIEQGIVDFLANGKFLLSARFDAIFDKEGVGFASLAEALDYLTGLLNFDFPLQDEKDATRFFDLYRDFKTIFGGAVTLREPTKKFNKKVNGTATITYTADERYLLSVSQAGDFAILQSTYNSPYFEGNMQIFDLTMELMQPQTGLVKRFGYWDMLDTVVNFAKIDGLLLETNNTQIFLRSYNDGVLGFEEDITSYSNWQFFNVLSYFFLWLGGALLEPFLFQPNGKVKALQKNSQIGKAGQFCKRPSKPITMAIESTGGAGSCKYVCSMIATKNIETWAGMPVGVALTTQVNTSSVGTYYHLKSVKIAETEKRGASVVLERIGLTGTSTQDAGILYITKNANLPTNNYARVGDSTVFESTNNAGSAVNAVDIGEVILFFEYNSNAPIVHNPEYIGKFLPISIDGNNPTYSFIFLSQSNTQSTGLVVQMIEFR